MNHLAWSYLIISTKNIGLPLEFSPFYLENLVTIKIQKC